MRYTLLIVWLMFDLLPSGAQETWDVLYQEDPFNEDALLDLRYLNEEVAGQNGFIALSANGEDFVDGNGDPIRFWAIGGAGQASVEAFRGLDDASLARFAKFLAKKGVNMIRYHGRVFSVTNDLNEPNRQEIDDIWRAVAAFRAEGIYMTISPFWAGHVDQMRASWGLGDYVGEIKPWGLMYFDEAFQTAYKAWVRVLFTETNPYTGISLKDDPAVAIIQIKNEDGVFFWTIQAVEPSLLAQMESQFHQWLIDKYGTIEVAYSAWGGVTLDTDAPDQGRIGQYIIWEATQEQSGGKDLRLTDQITFYAEVQRRFYQEMYDHYRALGCQQLINATNWKTADPLKLFDAERWTNAVCDIMAVNRYYAPMHSGPNSGWRIEPGHTYAGESVMKRPHLLPINVKQVAGKPFLVTESGWNLPHKYQAEGPFLIAAYMSLTGFDGFYWFNPSSSGIDPEPYWDFADVQGQTPMFRWTVSTPGGIDLFPANALTYRMGYLQEGDVLVHEHRSLTSIFGRETPLISEENSFDPNRDSNGETTAPGETEVAPLAYLAGKVRVTYDSDEANTLLDERLDDLLNTDDRRIVSSTGELEWDYDQGICFLNTDKAKGLCGFPEEGAYDLEGVVIRSSNEYIAVNVVSLDGQSLSGAEKILIQVGTQYRSTGWAERSAQVSQGDQMVDGLEITNVGQMPWQARATKVTVTISNANLQSAFALDQNGYESREVFVDRNLEEGTARISLPTDAMYVVVETRTPTVLDTRQGSLEEIRVFPNPNDGVFRIRGLDEGSFTEVQVRDLAGKLVGRYGRKNGYHFKLVPGIYLVDVRDGHRLLHSERVIVRR